MGPGEGGGLQYRTEHGGIHVEGGASSSGSAGPRAANPTPIVEVDDSQQVPEEEKTEDQRNMELKTKYPNFPWMDDLEGRESLITRRALPARPIITGEHAIKTMGRRGKFKTHTWTFGTTWLKALYHFWATLEWDEGHPDADRGATWIELAYELVAETGVWPQWPHERAQNSLWKWGEFFNHSTRALATLMKTQPFPDTTSKYVHTLRNIGCNTKAGTSVRPILKHVWRMVEDITRPCQKRLAGPGWEFGKVDADLKALPRSDWEMDSEHKKTHMEKHVSR